MLDQDLRPTGEGNTLENTCRAHLIGEGRLHFNGRDDH